MPRFVLPIFPVYWAIARFSERFGAQQFGVRGYRLEAGDADQRQHESRDTCDARYGSMDHGSSGHARRERAKAIP